VERPSRGKDDEPVRCYDHKRRGDYNVGGKFYLKIRGKEPGSFVGGRIYTSFVRSQVKVTRTRLGKYYISIPFEVKQKKRFVDGGGTICSLDPGVKRFQVWYTPNGEAGMIFGEDLLLKWLNRSDKLHSINPNWKRRTMPGRKCHSDVPG
jgi:transposase